MTDTTDPLSDNVRAIRRRIAVACGRSGRDPAEVRLVAATKYVDARIVSRLAAADVRDVGENRVPALLEKHAAVGDAVRWHMIGHMQRNKVRRALPAIDVLHSGDNLRLLRALDAEVERAARPPLPVLLEVNVSGETSKGGFSPEELSSIWPDVRALRHISLRGLMTMAPLTSDPENVRPVFATLREIRDAARGRGYLDGSELSMGMSSDFEIAVEEGATMVRVGRILFDGGV